MKKVRDSHSVKGSNEGRKEKSGVTGKRIKAGRRHVSDTCENKRKESKNGNGEHYVVVITNVENDFAKVHRETISRFCCLRPDCRLASAPSSKMTLKNGTAASEKKPTPSRDRCGYTVSARTETRSVEVSVYGKADGDVSTVFLPTKKRKELPRGNKSRGGTSVVTAADKAQKERVCDVVESVTTPTGSGTRFDSLADMVSTLRRRVYFTHPPHFLLNVEGMEDGAVLRSAKQGGLQGTDEKQLPPPGSCLGSKELRQSTVRQSEMVTVAATTSSRIGAKELRHQLRDVPGFVTCWWLHSQHFRLLFASKTALFKAKQLLDQFEVDGNVRVTITLPDGTSKEFVNHLAADEGGIL